MRKSIEKIPVSLFGAVMSLSGLSIAWKQEESYYQYNFHISYFFVIIATLTIIILLISYLIKYFIAKENVLAEFSNPVTLNFYGTIPISFLLLSNSFFEINYTLSLCCWIIGLILISILAYYCFYKWLNSSHPISTLNPGWMIPIVGTLDVAVSGIKLNFHYTTLFFTGIGLIFGFVFFTLILYRIVFIEPIPFKLQPSFFILTAPFTVGLSGYLDIYHNYDFFSHALFSISIFLLLVIIGKILLIKDCCPFMLTWWAVGFPIAAFVNACEKSFYFNQNFYFALLTRTALIFATGVIVFLACLTIYKIIKGELSKL
ncbi:hypothetical protein QEJ31_02605 [Pigmentibacter sp. JX0631]|uniref:SLAC1 family transporter n=1 Tax=Pigmentibacter sp. JX0631 TaxID=2976982 RepID=UPI0024685680|nr:hypothetical protein [Pigmentibacter sp. JX0631]WGL60492.1 hypothetical protein QEJ31_02605 [Pigmentibacter sp. JX0631]